MNDDPDDPILIEQAGQMPSLVYHCPQCNCSRVRIFFFVDGSVDNHRFIAGINCPQCFPDDTTAGIDDLDDPFGPTFIGWMEQTENPDTAKAIEQWMELSRKRLENLNNN